MFFQIRNTDSETLTEQVIGRIRRNPILTNWENYNDEQHKIAMKAFVWGDVSDGDRVFKRVKSVEEPKIEIQTTVLKDLKKIYENKKFDLKTFLNNKNVTNVKTIFELHKE
jgi:type III restriction enzyme